MRLAEHFIAFRSEFYEFYDTGAQVLEHRSEKNTFQDLIYLMKFIQIYTPYKYQISLCIYTELNRASEGNKATADFGKTSQAKDTKSTLLRLCVRNEMDLVPLA